MTFRDKSGVFAFFKIKKRQNLFVREKVRVLGGKSTVFSKIGVHTLI